MTVKRNGYWQNPCGCSIMKRKKKNRVILDAGGIMMKKQNYYCYGIVLYCFVLMFFIFTVIKSLHSMFLVPVTESKR